MFRSLDDEMKRAEGKTARGGLSVMRYGLVALISLLLGFLLLGVTGLE